jgi:hypothetical protein
VQFAQGLPSADEDLTLIGLSDRPQRIVGHFTTEQFFSPEGENSFASDPPNPVLLFVDPGEDRPDGGVVVLTKPQVSEDSISFQYQVSEGFLPRASSACTLFIDPLGRPRSPVSMAGVRRRARR